VLCHRDVDERRALLQFHRCLVENVRQHRAGGCFRLRRLRPGDFRQPRALGTVAEVRASRCRGQAGRVDCYYVPQPRLEGSVAAG
jgi:hypothetical protein